MSEGQCCCCWLSGAGTVAERYVQLTQRELAEPVITVIVSWKREEKRRGGERREEKRRREIEMRREKEEEKKKNLQICNCRNCVRT